MKAEDEKCPVCGYYCLGNGGLGCIDKPKLVEIESTNTLEETIDKARKQSHHEDGKCSMCAIGDEPVDGLHREQYRCGNEDTCQACHNAGMEYGDQCACCGRIEKQKQIMGG